jgi:hypothetical protein
VNIYSSASSTHRNFFYEKHSNLNFWWHFKVSQANCLWADFGKFWQLLGSFGQHRLWLTTCPNLGWNLKNLITFEPWVKTLCVTSHWKATIHIYNLKKIQKIQKFIAFTVAYPKSQNSMYGTHKPLGLRDTNAFECLCSMYVWYICSIFQVFIIYLNILTVSFNVFQHIYQHCNWHFAIMTSP